jgi:chemotaxis protein methyltransferase CheR
MAPASQLRTWHLDMTMSDAQFLTVANLIESKTGLQLPESKRPLVLGRLQSLVRQSGHSSLQDWFQAEMRRPSAATVSALVDAMTTNHTYFWREADHFIRLRDEVIPDIARKRKSQKDIRIWCGAASRGQEPYTIQMMAREALKDDYPNWMAGLLATDIDTQALAHSRRGQFSDEDVQRLPAELRQKYFRRTDPEMWQVVPDLQRDAVFRRLNLMQPTLPFKHALDVVFLRNVLIYFDNPTKEALLRRIHNQLAPGGWLFVGTSESLQVLSTPFQVVGPGAYRKRS